MEKKAKISINSILKSTFDIYFDQFIRIVGMGIVWILALVLFFLFMLMTFPKAFDYASLQMGAPVHLLFSLYIFFLSALFRGAAVFVAKQAYTEGEKISWWRSLGRAFLKLHLLAALSIITTFCIIVGLVFFILPGLFFAVCLSCYLPVILLGEKSLIEGWKETFALTKGQRFRVFFLFVVYMLIFFALLLFIALVALVPIFLKLPLGWLFSFSWLTILAPFILFFWFSQWVLTPFLKTVLYCELKKIHMPPNTP